MHVFFVEQGKRWQSREVHHHLGEEPGLHVGVEVRDGGQRMGFCPRERWRRTGRVRRTSGKSEIRLLSSKITLFGVKMTRIKSHDNVVLLSPSQLRNCAQSIFESLTSIVGWKAKDLGRLVNLKILLVNSFPALSEDQPCPNEMLSSYAIYLTCYPWDPGSVQLEEVLEVRRAESPGQGQRGRDPLSWNGVTMGFLLFQVQGQGPLWGFFFS